MNVMKQDAMDDKIRETCKTCEKQCMQRISIDREVSRSYRAYLDGSRRCRGSIEQTESFSIDPPGVEVSVETAIRSSLRSSTDSYVSRGIEKVSRCL